MYVQNKNVCTKIAKMYVQICPLLYLKNGQIYKKWPYFWAKVQKMYVQNENVCTKSGHLPTFCPLFKTKMST